MKKPPQKEAEIWWFQKFFITAQQPKWQNSCSQIWPIEQLFIELGFTKNKLEKFRKISRYKI